MTLDGRRTETASWTKGQQERYKGSPISWEKIYRASTGVRILCGKAKEGPWIMHAAVRKH
jgi:hypothetical protein